MLKGGLALGLSPAMTSLLLSLIIGQIVFCLFYNLTKFKFGPIVAKKALLLFCAFPSSIFLLAGYTEGIFFVFALSAVLLFLKKKYVFASLAVMFAASTRMVGLCLLPMFLFATESRLKKSLHLFIGMAGLILYLVFLQVQFGDFTIVAKAQNNWCTVKQNCKVAYWGETIIKNAAHESEDIIRSGFTIVGQELAFTLLFLIMTIPVYMAFGLPVFFYTILSILLPLVSMNSTFSMVRYVYAAFPVFMVLPLYVKNRYLYIGVLLAFFIMQLCSVIWFTNGYFMG